MVHAAAAGIQSVFMILIIFIVAVDTEGIREGYAEELLSAVRSACRRVVDIAMMCCYMIMRVLLHVCYLSVLYFHSMC